MVFLCGPRCPDTTPQAGSELLTAVVIRPPKCWDCTCANMRGFYHLPRFWMVSLLRTAEVALGGCDSRILLCLQIGGYFAGTPRSPKPRKCVTPNTFPRRVPREAAGRSSTTQTKHILAFYGCCVGRTWESRSCPPSRLAPRSFRTRWSSTRTPGSCFHPRLRSPRHRKSFHLGAQIKVTAN